MRLTIVRAASAMAAIMTSTWHAAAADLGPYYAPDAGYAAPEQPLEFGSGWYLRGDGAWSEENHPKFLPRQSSFDRNSKDSGYSLGLGAGYKFNSFLRVDVTGDFLDPFEAKAQQACDCGTQTVETNLYRWDALVNGYVDLGTWAGITPYVGAGAGVAGTRAATTVDSAGVRLQSRSRADAEFAWAAIAGFSYAFAPHMLVDINYRYLDLGPTTISVLPAAKVERDLRAQQVRVGIRYMVD